MLIHSIQLRSNAQALIQHPLEACLDASTNSIIINLNSAEDRLAECCLNSIPPGGVGMSKKKLLEVSLERITSSVWAFTVEGSLIRKHEEPVQLEVGEGSDLRAALAPASPYGHPVTPCAELQKELLAGLSQQEKRLLKRIVCKMEPPVTTVTFKAHTAVLRFQEEIEEHEAGLAEGRFIELLCEALFAEKACVIHAS